MSIKGNMETRYEYNTYIAYQQHASYSHSYARRTYVRMYVYTYLDAATKALPASYSSYYSIALFWNLRRRRGGGGIKK